MTNSLEYFLNPKSAAIIGVSPNWSYINTIFKQFVALKTPPKVYPVNPRYPDVDGIPCFPRLTDIPDPVELVMVSVPVRLVPDALQQCEDKAVKAVNIITSGFAVNEKKSRPVVDRRLRRTLDVGDHHSRTFPQEPSAGAETYS